MIRWAALLLVAALALWPGGPAHAQATVVASCGTPPSALSPGMVTPLFQDTTGKLCSAASLSGGATTLNATSTLPTLGAGTQTPQGSLAGANYVQEVFGSALGGGTQVDATHGEPVNCIAGCAGGTSSNASDAVATSSTNGQNLAWLYGFNGSTWDRLRDDGSFNLKVNLAANSFGTLTVTGTGGTFPVTGSVTANAGTNLNTSALALESGGNLASLLGRFPATGVLSDALSNPTVSGIGGYNLGWDATNTVWRRMQVDAGTGTVKVDGSGSTQPVSGTVTANAGTGTFTVGGTVTANQGGSPWGMNLTQWDTTALGAPSNYGTSPGAVEVPGVNAFVTNTPAVSQSGTWSVGLNAGSNTVGAVTQASGPWTQNVTQWDSTGLGAPSNYGTSPGAVAVPGVNAFVTNTPPVSQSGTWTVQPGNTPNTTPWLVTASNGCAGQTVANTSVKPFSLASTTALQLVAGVSAKQVYVCSIDIVSATANNVALIEGTQTTNPCDTATAGMAGGTTAATGWNFAANSGLTKGDGLGVVYRTATADHQVCLLASGTGQVSGSITYAQF